jgi:hypothetical protein
MTITRGFVDKYAGEYPTSQDAKVLLEVSPRVSERGYYDKADLLAVGGWKAVRATGYLGRNDEADIEYVTQAAFAAPDHLKHRFLSLLSGVQQAMASALLTVWDPEKFTVYDIRAMATLRAHGEAGPGFLAYPIYLDRCSKLAENLGVDLRTLDRALYAADGATD